VWIGYTRRLVTNPSDSMRLISALTLVLMAGSAPAVGSQSPAPADATAQAAPAAPASPAPTRIDPKAKPFLDRTLQALGGRAFLDFKTLTTHGRLFSLGGGGEGFVYYDSQTQYPDKRRIAYGLNKKGRPIVIINNGDQGWEIDRMGQIHLETSEIKQWRFANRYGLENLLRLTIHEPGVLVQSAGSDFVNNVNVDIIDVIDARGTQIKLDLGRQAGLPVQISYRRWDPAINDWDEYDDLYADYRVFEGVNTPMHITRMVNGERVSEVYRSTVAYNDAYPASLFTDPGIGH